MGSMGMHLRNTTGAAKAAATGLPTANLLLVLVLISTISGVQT